MLLLGAQLYRALLKEARSLPDLHLRDYYRETIRSAFRRREDIHAESSQRAVRRITRAQRLLKQLQAANDGYLHALQRTTETAYGIRGKGKNVALQPFLDLGLNSNPRERHSFPPPLTALVTSSIAHSSRAPTPAQLAAPPTLSRRADPLSEEARLLGPLIPQRIRAIKRRYWNMQTSKIRAPIAVLVEAGGSQVDNAEEAARTLGQSTGLDVTSDRLHAGWKRLQSLVEATAVRHSTGPLKPRRLQTTEERSPRADTHCGTHSLRKQLVEDRVRRTTRPPLSNTKWHAPKTITPRLMRRRMQDALAQAPVLTVKVTDTLSGEAGAVRPVRFDVTRHPAAKGEKGRFRPQSDEEAWWQQEAARTAPDKKKGSKKR